MVEQESPPTALQLRDLLGYFLRLGALGFGGPIALARYMQRDLAEQRHWVSHDEFQDGLAIAQTMPGPLAAQLAMWIGFIRFGVLGATSVGFLFIAPPFLIVVAVAALYRAYQGLGIIHALFYGIGPATIAIIALSAWKLAKSTDGRDRTLWGISGVLMGLTVLLQAELAWLFILAGLVTIVIYAPPWRRASAAPPGPPAGAVLLPLAKLAVPALAAGTLVTLTLFFLKAAAFTFGSGLAIVPFLHNGVVVEHHWLDERQFLDAVAMGIITPGPVVIMAAFVGYLVAGVVGALLAALAVFTPVWVFNVVIGRIFLRHRRHPQLRAFVKGATAAAVGAIMGAAVLLGRGALVDLPTVLICLVAAVVLSRGWLKEPAVVALAGLAGLLLTYA